MTNKIILNFFLQEEVVRKTLNYTAPRTMLVLRPLKVCIKSKVPMNKVSVPNFPDAPEKGTHEITFSNVIYIEQEDFMEIAEKGYRRLTKDQCVGLRHAGFVLKFLNVTKKDSESKTIEIECEATPIDKMDTKPKGWIHWVDGSSKIVEVRLYERLFKHKNPEDVAQVPNGFLSDVDENSLTVLKSSRSDPYLLKDLKVYDKFQFERIGFFSVDPDTTKSCAVFNRTVSLKEDAGK